MASGVDDMLMHQPPQPFDRIEMGAIGRDDVKLDPAALLRQPLPNQSGVMALLSNFGSVVLTDFGPAPVPQT